MVANQAQDRAQVTCRIAGVTGKRHRIQSHLGRGTTAIHVDMGRLVRFMAPEVEPGAFDPQDSWHLLPHPSCVGLHPFIDDAGGHVPCERPWSSRHGDEALEHDAL